MYREVNSLSRVSHQYIVRYYGCWLEDATPIEIPVPDETTPLANPATSSEEEDVFATNFDDLSISRRDMSRSASFPRIRFANSSNEEEDSDSEDSDSESSDAETAADPSEQRGQPLMVAQKQSASVTDGTTDDGMVQRILYIQMEFVEKVRQL